jgi:AraC-like DNA-binding protein
VLVPAGIEFEPILDSPVQQLHIQFEFVGWPAKAAHEVMPEPVVLEPNSNRDALAAEIREELINAKEIDPVLASRLKALVHLATAEALAQIPEERATRFLRIAEGQQELLAVLHHIDKHLDQPLNNARLAEIAMASESRFIRRFREATGRTPGRYVQDRRLRKAAELLISTDQSIDQIAETCGFANRYYFTRVFAQRMGCPPARYRTDRPYLVGEERNKLAS